MWVSAFRGVIPTSPLLLSKEIMMGARTFKNALIDDINDLSAGADLTNTETLSGADLEQLKLAARNGAAATYSGTTKTVGTNARYPGTPSNAALSGADLESGAAFN